MSISKRIGLALLICLLCSSLASCDRNRRSRRKSSKAPKAPVWKRNSKPRKGESSINALEGRSLTLECPANGHPKPTISWTRDGRDVKSISNLKIKQQRFNLVFTTIRSKDAGNYTCLVGNSLGNLNFTYTVEITKVKMLKVIPPQNVTKSVGESATFICRVPNDDTAKIRWLYKKMPHDSNSMRGTPQDAVFLPTGSNPEVLHIRNVTYNDAGKYTCLAGNSHDMRYENAWLKVIDRKDYMRKTMPPLIVSTWKIPHGTDPREYGKHANETHTQTKETYPALVSIWTIYIIVGSVSGGVLLIGLITIVVAVCCQKESSGTYKSTNV